jgi:hypothetical protein
MTGVQFFQAYGTAWGFQETLVSFYAPDGHSDKTFNVAVKGPEMLRRLMKAYLRFLPKCTVTFTDWITGERGFAAKYVGGTNDGPLRLHGQVSPEAGSPWRLGGISISTVNGHG